MTGAQKESNQCFHVLNAFQPHTGDRVRNIDVSTVHVIHQQQLHSPQQKNKAKTRTTRQQEQQQQQLQ